MYVHMLEEYVWVVHRAHTDERYIHFHGGLRWSAAVFRENWTNRYVVYVQVATVWICIYICIHIYTHLIWHMINRRLKRSTLVVDLFEYNLEFPMKLIEMKIQTMQSLLCYESDIQAKRKQTITNLSTVLLSISQTDQFSQQNRNRNRLKTETKAQ